MQDYFYQERIFRKAEASATNTGDVVNELKLQPNRFSLQGAVEERP